MKKIFCVISIFIISNMTNAQVQTLNTYYFKTALSDRCYDLEIKFVFTNKIVGKKDRNDNSISTYLSGLESREYNKRGEYVEIYTSKYVLEDFGIHEYGKLDKYSYIFSYDEKNGNLLYVYECEEGSQNGKFYFTEKGKQKYCE